MEKVLLFFSGGNDSTLSACKLASAGYYVYLITFDNGCEEGLENIRNRATTLEKIFENTTLGKAISVIFDVWITIAVSPDLEITLLLIVLTTDLSSITTLS